MTHDSPSFPAVHISLAALRHNYRLLHGISAAAEKLSDERRPARIRMPDGADLLFPWPCQLAVVKADAYGHGHIETAKALLDEGASLFASGSVQEAAQLRDALAGKGTASGTPPGIIALLGLIGPEDAALCAEKWIIPIIHSFEQLSLLAALGRPLSVAVKCDTGMSRLGFMEHELPDLKERLSALGHINPVIALSHLACADREQGKQEAARQGAIFVRMLASLRERWPDMAASLGNSAGTFLADDLHACIGPHVCRPGLALYGINPFDGTSLEAPGRVLQPVMSVSTPVIAVREINAGAGIGYDHTFTAESDMRIGIIAAGYADGFPRSLSNKGAICIEGVRAPIVGRVSMQMAAVDLGALPVGSRPATAWILGGPHANPVSAAELASWWGTITYEVFCLLGKNTRMYK